jgi:hypothetical protein
MKKNICLSLCLIVASSCMKSKEEYRQTIDEIQKEEAAPEDQNPERYRGSNDQEGMGDITE